MHVSVFGYICTYIGVTWDVISFNLITVLGYTVMLPVLDHLVICMVLAAYLIFAVCSIIPLLSSSFMT